MEVLGSSRFEVREIDVVDPGKCLEDLERIVHAHRSDAIHVAPFNTKLSCLAVYAFGFDIGTSGFGTHSLEVTT